VFDSCVRQRNNKFAYKAPVWMRDGATRRVETRKLKHEDIGAVSHDLTVSVHRLSQRRGIRFPASCPVHSIKSVTNLPRSCLTVATLGSLTGDSGLDQEQSGVIISLNEILMKACRSWL